MFVLIRIALPKDDVLVDFKNHNRVLKSPDFQCPQIPDITILREKKPQTCPV